MRSPEQVTGIKLSIFRRIGNAAMAVAEALVLPRELRGYVSDPAPRMTDQDMQDALDMSRRLEIMGQLGRGDITRQHAIGLVEAEFPGYIAAHFPQIDHQPKIVGQE